MHNTEVRVSVRANRFSIYYHYTGDRNRSGIISLQGESARLRQHGLSHKAGRNLRDCIDTLLFFANWKTVYVKDTKSYFRYKVNFITLTLPSKQIHTDREIIKECFNVFMRNWRKRRKGLLYIWKAEVQDNGNIHFHITSNAFYHYKKLRRDWNNAVNRLGYVDRATTDNPNSTDVHSVKNIRNLTAYLSSYYLKKDRYTKVLKEYFAKYGKELRKNNRDKTELPKNYFKHVKRVLDCQIWNASKILKQCKLNVEYNDKELLPEFERLFDVRVKWDLIFSDHATTLLNWTEYINEFKELRKRFYGHFEELMEIEMENTLRKEEVKSIA